MSVFAVVSKNEEVSEHDPHDAIIQDPPGPHDGGIQNPPVPPPSSRQRAVAHVPLHAAFSHAFIDSQNGAVDGCQM